VQRLDRGGRPRLAPLLDRDCVEAILAAVPEDWFAPASRADYVEYLCRRLEAPREFAREAEEARRAA
jgi:hypothetical protein